MDYIAIKKATAYLLRMIADYIDMLDVSPPVEIIAEMPPDVAAVAKEMESAQSKAPEPTDDEAKVVDRETLSTLMRIKINEGKKELVKGVLNKYGATKIKELNATDYQDAYKDLEVL